jgi:hypothetical protein
VGEKGIVDQRRLVTVTPFGVTRTCDGIADDVNLKTLFEEIA